MNTPPLVVENLTVEISTDAGIIRPVEDVSFSVEGGAVHGIVGESGCGKSTLLRAVLGLLPRGAGIVSGEVLIDGRATVALPEADRHRLRGHALGMVFQDPSSALNPVISVGRQVADGARHHLGLDRGAARKRAVALLRRVGIPDPEARYRAYPHELSGGMRQRVMIAIALSASPRILLCDEPTTALDVTIQDQILGLLEDIRTTEGVAIAFVSHDLAVVASLCQTVSVMYAGRVVESGPTGPVFAEPVHPYTSGLLASVPDVHGPLKGLAGIPGAPPDLAALPTGCAFAPRCPKVEDRCEMDVPPLVVRNDRADACTLVEPRPGTEEDDTSCVAEPVDV
jgi:oligopeptide/dipeptide ABC transporter ATP-binding protein